MAKNHLARAVIDRSVSDGAISHQRWDLVKQKLLGVFWKILKDNPGPPPQCDDIGWYQGHVKLMACVDERSASLLKLAVNEIGEVWEGAGLDVVSVSEIPRRTRSIAVIPSEPSDPEEILRILHCCNPHLPTHDWKVVNVTAPEGSSRKAIVVLNQDSLEPLREKQGKVYYGFSTIFLRVYRSDNKGNPAPTVAAAVQSTDCTVVVDKASSCDKEDTNSLTEMVGGLSVYTDEASDEDVLLESDQEDVNVTIIDNTEDGEGEADQPPPL